LPGFESPHEGAGGVDAGAEPVDEDVFVLVEGEGAGFVVDLLAGEEEGGGDVAAAGAFEGW
jgi:hypothetical protein